MDGYLNYFNPHTHPKEKGKKYSQWLKESILLQINAYECYKKNSSFSDECIPSIDSTFYLFKIEKCW